MDRRLRKYFDKAFKTRENVVLCGDLNVAPHELDVWSVPAWRNKLHFTKPERDAIQDLKKWGFVDLFVRSTEMKKNFHGGAIFATTLRKTAACASITFGVSHARRTL
jgi:exonuclease III